MRLRISISNSCEIETEIEEVIENLTHIKEAAVAAPTVPTDLAVGFPGAQILRSSLLNNDCCCFVAFSEQPTTEHRTDITRTIN